MRHWNYDEHDGPREKRKQNYCFQSWFMCCWCVSCSSKWGRFSGSVLVIALFLLCDTKCARLRGFGTTRIAFADKCNWFPLSGMWQMSISFVSSVGSHAHVYCISPLHTSPSVRKSKLNPQSIHLASINYSLVSKGSRSLASSNRRMRSTKLCRVAPLDIQFFSCSTIPYVFHSSRKASVVIPYNEVVNGCYTNPSTPSKNLYWSLLAGR